MTDEATREGAESAAVEAVATAPEKSGPERLKAILQGRKEPVTEAPAEPAPEGKQETEAPEQEAAAEQEAPAEENAEAPEAESAESQPPDLKAVAKMLGVSPSELVVDDDGTLAFKTKVDGQDGKAKLESLRKNYQLESAHTRRFMELSQKEKTLTEQQEKVKADLLTRAQQNDQYLALAKAELLGDLNRVDWESLKVNDPVEYTTKYVAFQERVARINQALQAREGERQNEAKAAEQRENARLDAEFKELLNHVPSWADDSTRKEGQKRIAEGLKSIYGFDDDGVKAISRSSHKAIRIVLDALAHHDAEKAAATAKAQVLKKVEAAPRMAKAGVGATQNSEARKTANLRLAVTKGDKKAGPEWLKRTVLQRNKQR